MEFSTLGLTGFQWIIFLLLLFGCFHYMWLVWDYRYSKLPSGLKEGFQTKMTELEKSRTTWFENDELFDEFYSTVYDSLTQLNGRYPQEVALILNQWKKTAELDTMDVLDCGCGSGIATVLFAKMGVKSSKAALEIKYLYGLPYVHLHLGNGEPYRRSKIHPQVNCNHNPTLKM
jgi:SAM-dependent methyltransferase